MKQPTFQYHPGTFGMSKAQELWIIFPESCHSCNFRPVIGFPGFLPHIEHKDLEVVRGHLISSKPFSVTKHDFLLDQSRAPRAEVPRAAHGHHRSPKHQARLGQPGSPRTATAPPASRPAGTAPEAAGTRTSKRSVPAMGWQSRGSWQGHAAVRPSIADRNDSPYSLSWSNSHFLLSCLPHLSVFSLLTPEHSQQPDSPLWPPVGPRLGRTQQQALVEQWGVKENRDSPDLNYVRILPWNFILRLELKSVMHVYLYKGWADSSNKYLN